MAEYLVKWPSGREPVSKIRPSDGCGRDAVPLAVERWYNFHEFGCHLGNVGLRKLAGTKIAYIPAPRISAITGIPKAPVRTALAEGLGIGPTGADTMDSLRLDS